MNSLSSNQVPGLDYINASQLNNNNMNINNQAQKNNYNPFDF